MSRLGKGICSLCLLILALTPGFSEETTVIIGTKNAPPFAMKDANGAWYGLTITLTEHLAEDLGVKIQWVERDLKGLLTGVADGSLNASAAAITMTLDRERQLDFSHPYYHTGLGMLINANNRQSSWWAVVAAFFNIQFLQVVLGLSAVLFLAGLAMWALERKANPKQFGGPPRSGLWSGFWWSSVTMSTVGYGDKAPVTVGGKLVALVWMLMSMTIMASYIAQISSSLTLSGYGNPIQGPADLPGRKVAVVANSTSETYGLTRGLRLLSFNTLEEAILAVEEGNAEVAVHDMPLLKHHLLQNPEANLTLVNRVFEPQNYAIALPENSPHREALNQGILTYLRSTEWQALVQKYLGSSP